MVANELGVVCVAPLSDDRGTLSGPHALARHLWWAEKRSVDWGVCCRTQRRGIDAQRDVFVVAMLSFKPSSR